MNRATNQEVLDQKVALSPTKVSDHSIARGVLFSFTFSRCQGPVTVKAGLHDAVRRAVANSGVNVVGKVRFQQYPDDTANAAGVVVMGDLAESHFMLGTYLGPRAIKGEVNMCHETCDNTELARRFVNCLQDEFRPVAAKIDVLPWESE